MRPDKYFVGKKLIWRRLEMDQVELKRSSQHIPVTVLNNNGDGSVTVKDDNGVNYRVHKHELIER